MNRRAHPARGKLRRPWFLPRGRRLSDEVWEQRHRGLTILLWLHIPTLFAFVVLRGYGLVSAAVDCAALVVAALLAQVGRLSRNLRSASTSLGLVLAASFFVHAAGGAIEAHFQFFVILAFLTLYQTWLPLLLALGYVVVEHGVIGVLDPRAVYNDSADIHHPWRYAAIHGAFVLAASFANILSWRLTEHEALHDGLTGLPNRTYFLDAVTGSLGGRASGSTAVVYIDLDNFKDANDGFGHELGDLLLQALSERLTATLRPGDLLARLGGDEFAVALGELRNRDEGLAVAERLLAVVSQPVYLDGITIVPAASLGLAFAAGAASATDLLRNADLAMYDAKRNGGRRVAEYQPRLHTVALARTELAAELRAALEQDQFVLHYQPILDLQTNQIVGTEALVRWQHPVRGLLPPGDFIPAAEQSGLIVPLGAWVLRAACHQTALWHAGRPDAPPLSVSVNLAPLQLADRTLVTTVAEALHNAHLDATSLCLEVTEGSIIKDIAATMPILNALRTLGVSLALDDFGTGYSSLSYLKQLPVNSVKIDRSFVGDLDSNADNCEIVRAIISLAHALGLTVTAEGAETETQLAALRSMRSDHAQGYVFGRPMPAAEFTALLDAADTTAGKPVRPRSPSVSEQRPGARVEGR